MAYLMRLSKQLEPPPVPGSELVPLPTPAAATESGMDAQRYDDLLLASTGLSADTQQILFQLRNMLSRDAYHNQLLRDLEWFHAEADAFHRSLRVGLPLPEAQRERRPYAIRG